MLNLIKTKRIDISLLLNYTIILYVFLLPLSKAFSFATGPYVLLILWLAEKKYSDKIKIFNNKLFFYFFIFFAFSSISILWSDAPDPGLKTIKSYASLLIISIVIATSLKKEFVKPLLYAFFISIFINELMLYSIYFEIIHVPWTNQNNPHPKNLSHIHYSYFLAITIFLLIYDILEKNNKTPLLKLIEIVFLLSTITNLFLNIGKTGQVSLLCGSFVFMIIYFKEKMKYFLTILFSLILVILIAWNFSHNFKNRILRAQVDIKKVLNDDFSGQSIGSRLAIQKLTLDAIRTKPFLGHGVGNFEKPIQEAGKSNPTAYRYGWWVSSAHNDFLQIALFTGVIGLCLYICFLFYVAKELAPSNRLLRATFFSLFTIMICVGMFSMNYKFHYAPLFGILIGYFYVIKKYNLYNESQEQI